ncbi:hypothetical protein PP175_05170 [Aneurinibacillus sp. Ricciae_BoGa-3]|uniref:hypothetical protein n=1 Tax=Aneurinibacillus sp. Ricciae_BoGa-3 TaxID=3022697 RepID=UPI0023424E95|nr:hypothetical protein [Aneurinibacillus sp. Ricciae_BoGa-3]WCK55362.1 hypothetical protein PP175_05170 [Aneurinibacillus sp. Ricciae_BoGa-3]
MVKRSENNIQVIKTAGTIPDILVDANFLDVSVADSLVLPLSGHYELWVKTVSFLSFDPMPELQEMIDIVVSYSAIAMSYGKKGKNPTLYRKMPGSASRWQVSAKQKCCKLPRLCLQSFWILNGYL